MRATIRLIVKEQAVDQNEVKRDRREKGNRILHSTIAESSELAVQCEAIVAEIDEVKRCSEEGEGSHSRLGEEGKRREARVGHLDVAIWMTCLVFLCQCLPSLRILLNKGCPPSGCEV